MSKSSPGLLLLACLCSVSAAQKDLFTRGPDEPPRGTADARLDLPMDLSGRWEASINGGVIVTNQWIWQECLEFTITGNSSLASGQPVPMGAGGAPLHHMIANGEYITYDDTNTTTTGLKGQFSYKAIITAPTKMEAADGATATLVFYADETTPGGPGGGAETTEIAIRYIDSEGRLAFQQNQTAMQGAGIGLMKMTKAADVPCAYSWTAPESFYCSSSWDGATTDTHDSFTPACCADGYKGSTALYTSIAAPVWKGYVANCGEEPAKPDDGGLGSDDASSAANKPPPVIATLLLVLAGAAGWARIAGVME